VLSTRRQLDAALHWSRGLPNPKRWVGGRQQCQRRKARSANRPDLNRRMSAPIMANPLDAQGQPIPGQADISSRRGFATDTLRCRSPARRRMHSGTNRQLATQARSVICRLVEWLRKDRLLCDSQCPAGTGLWGTKTILWPSRYEFSMVNGWTAGEWCRQISTVRQLVGQSA